MIVRRARNQILRSTSSQPKSSGSKQQVSSSEVTKKFLALTTKSVMCLSLRSVLGFGNGRNPMMVTWIQAPSFTSKSESLVVVGERDPTLKFASDSRVSALQHKVLVLRWNSLHLADAKLQVAHCHVGSERNGVALFKACDVEFVALTGLILHRPYVFGHHVGCWRWAHQLSQK